MKKYLSAVMAVILSLSLASCAPVETVKGKIFKKSLHEISVKIINAENLYKSGSYLEAQSNLIGLDKKYKKMTDEQKSRYDAIFANVDNAVRYGDNMNYCLDTAQNLYNEGLYYEASAELDKLQSTYTLPPVQQEILDAKRAIVNNGITVEDTFAKVGSAYSNGDYNTSSSILSSMDVSIMNDTQKQKYQDWLNKVASGKAQAEAQAQARAAAAAAAAATPKYNSDGSLYGAAYYDGEYHYKGRPVGKGDLKMYAHGEISEAELERRIAQYNR